MSYLFIRQSDPKARKRHRCIWCGEHIEIGDRYTRCIGIFDGGLQSDAYHPECRNAANELFAEGEDEFSPHENERPLPLATTP